jgi:hypothetical protein
VSSNLPMESMFRGAGEFNQDISSWVLVSAEGATRCMFIGALTSPKDTIVYLLAGCLIVLTCAVCCYVETIMEGAATVFGLKIIFTLLYGVLCVIGTRTHGTMSCTSLSGWSSRF